MQPIDLPRTYDRIRSRHGSVQRYFMSKGWKKTTFYLSLSGQRGTTDRPTLANEVRRTLKEEDLIVFKEADDAA